MKTALIKGGKISNVILTGEDWVMPQGLADSAMPLTEARALGYVREEIQAPAREWPNAAAFLDTFTRAEKGAIWNSEHSIVGSLTLDLVAWQGIVLADDPHIVAGMGLLVQLGILTQARHDEILGL